MTGPLDPPGYAPTNGRVAIEGDDHWVLDDGHVTSCRVLYDQLAVGRQIGALPQPGTSADRVGVWLQRLTARGMRRRNR